MKREYQRNFFELHSGIRNEELRNRKAEKIFYLLNQIKDRDFRNLTCLDVGCSAGFVTVRLAELFRRTYGLELDFQALAQGPGNQGNAVFLAGDAMSLPYANESMDVIICAQVYEHVPDDRILVDEIYRVLKPGGIVFFSGPNKLFPIELHYDLPFLQWFPEKIADQYLKLFKRGDHYYERSRTYWSLRLLLSRFTMTDITHDVIGFLLMNRGYGRSAFLRSVNSRKLWSLVVPFVPNFNFILTKPNDRTGP